MKDLLSALAVPRHTHEGKDLHQGILAKATALMRSLIKNHPFIDGNKRTAVLAVLLFLEMNGYTLRRGHNKLVRLATAIANNHYDVHRIERWLKKYTEHVPKGEMRGRAIVFRRILPW
ncbi:MAG: type II toxin-antitoxin system death-on-curing family toxin [Firmicutes bacterium]|nr:type II toxin-antitoxin system death-on-curing family toxin [Bacillota bacterium]